MLLLACHYCSVTPGCVHLTCCFSLYTMLCFTVTAVAKASCSKKLLYSHKRCDLSLKCQLKQHNLFTALLLSFESPVNLPCSERDAKANGMNGLAGKQNEPGDRGGGGATLVSFLLRLMLCNFVCGWSGNPPPGSQLTTIYYRSLDLAWLTNGR